MSLFNSVGANTSGLLSQLAKLKQQNNQQVNEQTQNANVEPYLFANEGYTEIEEKEDTFTLSLSANNGVDNKLSITLDPMSLIAYKDESLVNMASVLFTMFVDMLKDMFNSLFGGNNLSTNLNQNLNEPIKEETTQSKIAALEKKKANLNEQIAAAGDEYVAALNNRTLMFTYSVSANDGKVFKDELNYHNLTSDLNSTRYRLTDSQTGKILCADKSEAARYVNIYDYANLDEQGNIVGWKNDTAEAEYNYACDQFFENNMQLEPALKNQNYLQDALLSGSVGIQKQTYNVIQYRGEDKVVFSWENENLKSMANISSELYTNDDTAAMVIYENKVANYKAEIATIDAQIAAEKAQQNADNLASFAKTELEKLEAQKAQLDADKHTVSQEYVEKLNNTTLMFTFQTSANLDATVAEELTYQNFTSDANATIYRLVDAQTGKIICADKSEVTRYVNINNYAYFDAKGNFMTWKDENAEANYNKACEDFYNNNMVQYDAAVLYNNEALHSAMENGTFSVQERVVTSNNGNVNISWQTQALNEMSDVSSELYTVDDNAAMAKYEYESLQIETKEKAIDAEIEKLKSQKTEVVEEPTVEVVEPKEPKAEEFVKNVVVTNTPTSETTNSTKEIETKEVKTQNKSHIDRQIERYEKYIERYEKQIEFLESSNLANKDAKIASLMDKIEKYMNKIQELID